MDDVKSEWDRYTWMLFKKTQRLYIFVVKNKISFELEDFYASEMSRVKVAHTHARMRALNAVWLRINAFLLVYNVGQIWSVVGIVLFMFNGAFLLTA